jgi:hypothetical protein
MTVGNHFEPDPREMLRTAMNAIHQQPDTGLLPAELAAIDDICDQVQAYKRDDADADATAWHRAAVATKSILRYQSKGVVAEWIRAYSELPPMSRRSSDRRLSSG